MGGSCITLMTALVPTLGHAALIEFMSCVAFNKPVYVIVSSRSFEPISGSERVGALQKHFMHMQNVIILSHEDDNAPQNPSTEEEWNYWKNVVESRLIKRFPRPEYFVSSESYGKKMAEILGIKFIPFDMDRTIVNCRGTDVRKNIPLFYDQLIPFFRRKYQTKFTFFGQESCGKTTMTKNMHDIFKDCSIMTHEFARPYLEAMDDVTITEEKMLDITIGQYSLQKIAYDQPVGIVFQDTDLLSTLGYYKLWNGKSDLMCKIAFEQTKSDLYFVMNDEIPFEEDKLRYGGNKRETDKQFWIDLLEEYGCNYYVVKSVYMSNQILEIEKEIEKFLNNKFEKISSFMRD